MLALYQRLGGRCRTRNQLNQVHIALENRMTPAELVALWRHYHGGQQSSPVRLAWARLVDKTRDALLGGHLLDRNGPDGAQNSLHLASQTWTAQLHQRLMLAGAHPVADFKRERLAQGAARYSNGRPRAHKTLLLCFSGNAHRMMMPMAVFLQQLDPDAVDAVYLRTDKNQGYRLGIRGIADDLHTSIDRLPALCQAGDYARVATLGTSGGGLPAVLAALKLGAASVLAVGANHPEDPRWADHRGGGDGADLFRRFRGDAAKLPAVHLVHGANDPKDGDNNRAIARHLPTRSVTAVDGCGHSALFPLVERGQFQALLRATVLPRPPATQAPTPHLSNAPRRYGHALPGPVETARR